MDKLKRLFDYQDFEPNDRLTALINATKNRYPAAFEEKEAAKVVSFPGPNGVTALSDDDMELAAAGVGSLKKVNLCKDPKCLGKLELSATGDYVCPKCGKKYTSLS